jgi:hypothetical protein
MVKYLEKTLVLLLLKILYDCSLVLNKELRQQIERTLHALILIDLVVRKPIDASVGITFNQVLFRFNVYILLEESLKRLLDIIFYQVCRQRSRRVP